MLKDGCCGKLQKVLWKVWSIVEGKLTGKNKNDNFFKESKESCCVNCV
jgi:hypothetical protein